MCSYNSPTFLFQPIEMLCLAAIARDWKGHDVSLLDSIAEGTSTEECLSIIDARRPDYIVCLSGFECFEEDMAEIATIKRRFPHTPIVLFGHYATEFPEIILEQTAVDYIIHGEPDLIFSDLLDVWNGDKSITSIKGLSYRANGIPVHQKGHSRIPDPSQLPMPAFDLLKNHLYSEPFFPKPYGLIQSARGCPYQCNYCVKSFGTKLTALSPENIILQLERYIELFSIQSFRFIDDTFTAVPQRVIEFCKLMIEKGYQRLQWSCLSRPDTLNHEMLEWMKKAGCVRIYVGVESGSEEVLNFYNKRIDLNKALGDLKFAKSLDFELVGLFMVGAPNETRNHVKRSIAFAYNAGFDLVVVSKLIPYPGTPLFEKVEQQVVFSLLPYENKFSSDCFIENAYHLQKHFYRSFYINRRVVFALVKRKFFSLFREFGLNTISFAKFLLIKKKVSKRRDYI